MQVTDALNCLGSDRVIWVDDNFGITPTLLARDFVQNIEVTLDCDFEEINGALEIYQFDAEKSEADVRQILTDLPAARFAEIRQAFVEKRATSADPATPELSKNQIEAVCGYLGVALDDRWTFEKADTDIPALCEAGDEKVSYVVDLSQLGGLKTRGLGILQKLVASNSKGTAFLLTHETDVAGEAALEATLRKELADSELDEFGVPICVVSKGRLTDEDGGPGAIEVGLKIGIKRAGLRRAMHEVLIGARKEASKAFEEASRKLLSVPPEHLDAHVFEQGFKEGVSELHVVERALTSHAGQQLRVFFGSDKSVHKNVARLRALRNIQLDLAPTPLDENLLAFRKAEVWESDELINSAFAPIACGDVFETDDGEKETAGANKKFLLLGQPCDILLRPDGKRGHATAFFVLLKKRPEPWDGNPKVAYFPFKLDGAQWACDFREATVVRLSILDLASFRQDGRVRVDEGHEAPIELLTAQSVIYADRTASASRVLQDGVAIGAGGIIDPSLQLCFASDKPFKSIHAAAFVPHFNKKQDGDPSDNVKRVTWRLRRHGRIRMPFATALLDQYMDVMSRKAFEIDFMDLKKPREPEAIQSVAVQAPEKPTEEAAKS